MVTMTVQPKVTNGHNYFRPKENLGFCVPMVEESAGGYARQEMVR